MYRKRLLLLGELCKLGLIVLRLVWVWQDLCIYTFLCWIHAGLCKQYLMCI